MGVLDHKRGSLPRASSPQAAPSFPSGEWGGVFENSNSATASEFDTATASDTAKSEARPQASADAREGAYFNGTQFLHFCHCGKWGAFGSGVSFKHERLGTWVCGEHREGRA